jgi:hypothetical protein
LKRPTYFNAVILYQNGTGSTITNLRADTKKEAFINVLENRFKDVEEIVSISIIKQVDNYE